MAGDLKIIGIQVKNYKRLELFRCHLDPEKGLVTIGGQNAAGKSSLLDAIYAALVRPDPKTKNPVNDSADHAEITVLIGTAPNAVEYKVKRTFTRGGTPGIKVTRDGQEMRDSAGAIATLLGRTIVDPVEFIDMPPIKQRETLAGLVGLDLSAYDHAIQEALTTERQADQYQKSLEARVQQLPWHSDAPEEEMSAAQLSKALAEAHSHNQRIDTAAQQIELRRQESERLRSAAVQCDADIERLRAQIAELEGRKAQHLEASQKALDEVPQLQELASAAKVDTTHLENQITEVETLNNKRRDNLARIQAKAEWQKAEQALNQAITARKDAEHAKKHALSQARFPVEGLGFDEKQVTFKGQPFSQASGAEQIRAAVAISLAMRGRLGLLLIKDASKLDAKSLALLAEEAERHGAQVICEIVANPTDDGWDKDCDFYIVDGHMQEVPA